MKTNTKTVSEKSKMIKSAAAKSRPRTKNTSGKKLKLPSGTEKTSRKKMSSKMKMPSKMKTPSKVKMSSRKMSNKKTTSNKKKRAAAIALGFSSAL